MHEVATIDVKLLATAIWIGRWRTRVSMGTTIKPPPTPNIEPRKPENNPIPPSAQILTSFKPVARNSSTGTCSRSIGLYYRITGIIMLCIVKLVEYAILVRNQYEDLWQGLMDVPTTSFAR